MRPCQRDHPYSPGTCPQCCLLTLDNEQGREARAAWRANQHASPDEALEQRAIGQMVELLADGSLLEHRSITYHAGNALGDRQWLHSLRGAYRPGDLFPGVVDPLPGPDPEPMPGQWAWSAAARETHSRGVRDLVYREIAPPPIVHNEGIVYVGGGRYWPMIVVAVKMARRYTDVPIQIWHAGDAEPVNPADLDGTTNIAIVSSRGAGYPVRINGGWENKTTAILNSGFSCVIYLDADAYLVADPAPLFAAARANRFAFWADLPWNDATVDWAWSGVANTSRIPPIQGGQLGIDIVSFWRELLIAHYINQHSRYFYAHQYGDQDSWRIALAATGGQHHVLGAAGWQPPAFVCRYPAPLVVHRCQAKLWGTGQVCFHHDLPEETAVRGHYNDQVVGKGSAEEVFGRIYQVGMWGQKDSSGDGSSESEARALLTFLSGIKTLIHWRVCVDLGCGDGRVTRLLPFDQVVGVDCHLPHIARLSRELPDLRWYHLDMDRDREDLPSGQLALVKDVFHHWPSALILDWVTWAIHSGKWDWIVIAGDCHQRIDGEDITLGGYRALNPAMEPLRSLPVIPLAQYLHKQILILNCVEQKMMARGNQLNAKGSKS